MVDTFININVSKSTRVGEHDTKKKEGSETDYKVKKVFQHPGFDKPTTLNNDIAVLELEKPIQFNKYVQPACLPEFFVKPGTECYVTGKLPEDSRVQGASKATTLTPIRTVGKVCYSKNRSFFFLCHLLS